MLKFKNDHCTDSRRDKQRDQGSALVMAVFVLFLLTSVGGALLFLSQNEVKMSKANMNSIEAFYMAEAGLEAARAHLWQVNGLGDFSDDLEARKGLDDDISLIDPGAITPIFDSSDQLIGLNGVGDDPPLIAITVAGRGSYAAYLTNDPLEARNNEIDLNDRVSLVAVGVGPDRSFEVVEAIIERRPLIPMDPPATITVIGPPPVVDMSNSAVKEYIGTDCDGSGGIAGLYLPVVGTIGGSAELSAEAGINTNPDYISGTYSDEDAFADLTDPTEPTVVTGLGTIDPRWTKCEVWQDTLASLRDKADVICSGGSCVFPNYGPSRLIYIDDDYALGNTQSGAGTLVVTGTLTFTGNADWDGLILVVGEGAWILKGGGNGVVSGSIIVADIAGPDDIYGTGDDCTGGTDGFGQGVFDESGGGNSGTHYCSTNINASNQKPYEVVEFLQR